ncbi:hypothetical protein BX666DRAFT_354682 [Dichotomocladium elegans]|nr:hypothetical protein BX666DRAFT_354682 [Dichotomocladium elegans]
MRRASSTYHQRRGAALAIKWFATDLGDPVAFCLVFFLLGHATCVHAPFESKSSHPLMNCIREAMNDSCNAEISCFPPTPPMEVGSGETSLQHLGIVVELSTLLSREHGCYYFSEPQTQATAIAKEKERSSRFCDNASYLAPLDEFFADDGDGSSNGSGGRDSHDNMVVLVPRPRYESLECVAFAQRHRQQQQHQHWQDEEETDVELAPYLQDTPDQTLPLFNDLALFAEQPPFS